MPFLDVSSVLLDPDFADRFTVIRRVESVSDYGRRVLSLTNLPAVGVVTMASPDDLKRVPEGQTFDRTLSIVSKFPFFGASVGYQPDLVLWYGDLYIVVALDPYPQFGAGFSQVIVGSIDLQDLPIPKPGQTLDVNLVLDTSTLGA